MFEAADYKLSDMLGIAGATIGIIIAAGIILGYLTTRAIDAFAQFRKLTDEYRGNHFSDTRRGGLQQQIARYINQFRYLNSASISVGVAVLLFLVTVTVASLSVIYPKALVLRLLGTFTLLGGLVLIGLGVFLSLLEMLFQRTVLNKETADFGDLPAFEEALRK